MTEPLYFIEHGYLELHLWTTYKCNVGCPHCYLKALEVKSPDLTLADYEKVLKQIYSYRRDWNTLRIVIYGAEPQSLPAAYYQDMMTITLQYFRNAEFSMYTSLQKLDRDWIDVFKRIKENNGLNMTAVSYDGLMRGEQYNINLFRNLDIFREEGMRVGMMTVLNKTLLTLGPKHYVDVLDKYNFASFSIKPFLPIRGQQENWDKWAANMDEYSDYVIDVHKELKRRGIDKISGMLTDVAHTDTLTQGLGGWVVFMDGDLRFMYMGYDGTQEFLQEFGRIDASTTFKDIVESPLRKQFLSEQRFSAFREDCITCEYAGRCLVEVYKPNYDNSSECPGAKRFIQWVNETYGVLHDTKI